MSGLFWVVLQPWSASMILPLTPSSLLTPGNHWSFYDLNVLPSPKCCIILTIQCVAIKDCLILLNKYTFKDFLTAFHSLINYLYFSLNNNIPLSKCIAIDPFSYWEISWLFPSFVSYKELIHIKQLCAVLYRHANFFVNNNECYC